MHEAKKEKFLVSNLVAFELYRGNSRIQKLKEKHAEYSKRKLTAKWKSMQRMVGKDLKPT